MAALTRTISKGMQSANRSRNAEFNEDNAIIYDPLNGTLFQGSMRLLKKNRSIEIPIKDCRTSVDIMVPLSSPTTEGDQKKLAGDGCGIYLATVDLRRLGKTIKNAVRNGKIKKVYVLGYVPERLIPDSSAEDSDGE